MRTLVLLILFTLINHDTPAANNPKEFLRIGVISDLHFLSESLMDNETASKNYVNTTGKDIIDVPEILDQVIQNYLSSDIQILLISGDLTKDGEKQSHIDLIQKFSPLIHKGVKIYVIPGNHDINIPNSVGFKGDKSFSVDNLSKTDFVNMYHNFGYGTALYQDSSSLSYIAELNPETWLMALDGCLYDQYSNQSISGGKIKDTTIAWIKKMLSDAKLKNKQVIGMMHHGLVEHFPMQSKFFKDYLIENNQTIASILADNGMEIIFTGHFHANDITQFTSRKGNRIYDIETGSLCSYPFTYRFIKLNRNEIDIKTRNITETKSNPNLVEESITILKQQAKIKALSKINNTGINFPSYIKDEISNMAGEMFIQHLAGDEVINSDFLNFIKITSDTIDDSYSDSLDSLQFDFYPPDNNVKIELNSN